MTDMVNDIEHANNTNPCQGVCVVDSGFCIACMRTAEERSRWYELTNAERDQILEEITIREQGLFDEN
jgi:predicted Fe-S protein YdhL (DUF1289 family)